MAKKKVTIEAGPLRKVYVYTPPMPRDTERKRAERKKITTRAQKELNKKTAYGTLENILACNFSACDLWVTLTYDEQHKPKNRKAALKCIRAFIRAYREERKRRGKDFVYIYCTEEKTTNGRLHHHMVINATGPEDLETICAFWKNCEPQAIEVKRFAEGFENIQDAYLSRAQYMTKEYDEKPNGAQTWSGSKNLKRPITRREWIKDNEVIDFPPDADPRSRSIERYQNDFGEFIYLKYLILQQRPGAAAGIVSPAGPERATARL